MLARWALAVFAPVLALAQEPREAAFHVAAGEIELVDLVRSCADAMGVAVDFEPAAIEGAVTIDSGPGVSIEGLWATTNRLLAEKGLACVQVPGEDTLSVVALDKAAGLARLESGELDEATAGYVKVLRAIHREDAATLAKAVQDLLPKDGSVAATLSGERHLLVAGLKAQVSEALEVLTLLDRVPSATVVEEVAVEHLSATALAALLEQLAQKRKAVDGVGLRGSVVADPSARTLLVVAPEDEVPLWRDLVRRFDRAEVTFTKQYVPRRFGLEETAELLTKVMAAPAGAQAPTEFRMVQDTLTGSLIVTATFSQHQELQGLLDRLEGAEVPPRRAMRSFAIEHRDAEDMVALLQSLIGSGEGLPAVIGDASEEGEGGPLSPTAPPPSVRARPGDSPTEVTLSADKGTNRVLAFGDVRLLGDLEELIRALDVQDPQVLVEVLVVSLTESQMRSLGVELQAAGESDGRLFQLSSLFGLGSPEIGADEIPAITAAGGTGVVLNPGDFSAVLRALETMNDGRTMTVPKILVANHEDATLNSVLQTPFTTIAATTTVATTTFGGTSDAGTSITVTPHIQSGDRLRLDYSVSISSFVGEPTDPALPPPRQENLLDSAVTIPDGHAIVLGGLDVESESDGVTRVPLLGRLPVLGSLFQSRTRSRSTNRFFVFLRCSVLRREGFEDLRYVSGQALGEAGVDDGWPVLEPRIMR